MNLSHVSRRTSSEDHEILARIPGHLAMRSGMASESALAKFEKLLPQIDSASVHTSVRSLVRALPKAGRWLLDRKDYVLWKTGRSPSHLLWINGIPGSGKTILCSRVIDDVRRIQDRDPRVAVLFFYCPENVASKDIFASLLRQLLHTVLSEAPAPLEALELDQLAGSLDDLPFTDLIIRLSGAFKRTFVVVDGLDRCKSLGDAFLELSKLSQVLHVFVSCRDCLSLHHELVIYPKVTVSQADVEDDVRRYVEIEVEGLKLQDPMSRKSIVDKLVQGAEGTFLWLAHQMQALRGARSDSEIEQVLVTVPSGQVKIVVAALESMDSKPHSKLLISILHLVLCAKSPISSRALVDAVKTLNVADPGFVVDTMSLVDDCGALLACVPATQRTRYKYYWPNEDSDVENWDVVGSGDNDIVVLSHPSLKQLFLANPAMLPTSLNHYTLPLNVIHDGIARLCLSHLNLMLKHIGREAVAELSNGPFAQYALYHWLDHVHASEKDVEEFKDLMTPWRGIKTTKWVPEIVHMAVRLNMLVNKALPRSKFAAVDSDGLRPLHVALKNSAPLAIIDWLVEHVDVNQASDDGVTALHFAVMYHREPEDTIKRLLTAGADVGAKAGEGVRALHVLLQWGIAEHTEPCILVLLDHGADVNAQDSRSRTPLHTLARHARQSDYVELVSKCLMKHGAKVDASDTEGRTPLHEAAQGGCISLVSSLLRNGAPVDAIDNCGDTPLALALGAIDPIKVTPHGLIVQLLLAHNANINKVRNYPDTAKEEAEPPKLGVERQSNIITSLRRKVTTALSESGTKSNVNYSKKDLAQMKDAAESNQRLVAELESCKLETARQSQLVTSLREQLETAQSDSIASRKAADDLKNELAEVKKDGTDSTQRLMVELESSKLEVARQSKLVASLHEQLETAQSGFVTRGKAADDLEKELAQVKKDGAELNQRLVTELDSSKLEASRHSKAVASLREQLKKERLDVMAMKRSKATSDLEKESLQAKNRSLMAELESLEVQLKDQSSLVHSLRRELETAQAELRVKDDTVNSLMRELDCRWSSMMEDINDT